VERKLVPDEKFAPLIKFMFQRFIELRSPQALAQEMNAKVLAEYSQEDAKFLKPFTRTRIYTLLHTVIYK
jgi:hypothetical protein